MPRIARITTPGIPHHVTQRGNRRMQTFFCDEDYQAYLALMAAWCGKFNVSVWCYCLMPNHVHLIAVPETEEGLRMAIGEAHRHYSVMIISGRNGPVICGRDDFPRSRWTRRIFLPPPDISR